jgi:aryl-alcohol dehydrogenase-like predicted oxidoreductase
MLQMHVHSKEVDLILPGLNQYGFRMSAIGLGCSRLGSIMGSSTGEAEALVAAAIEHGITFFDTASSYGQGDSELILGRALRKNDRLCVVTKIGKRVPIRARLLQPLKGLVRNLAKRSGNAGDFIKKSRSAPLPTCFDLPFLSQELDKSRRRLGVDCVPMVMLHSAPEMALRKGEAIDFLDRARERGAIQMVGASVDDLYAAEAALSDNRISAIQAPLREGDVDMAKWAERARAAGRIVIAREVLHGLDGGAPILRADVHRRLLRILGDKNVGVSLVGTTKLTHLSELMEIARSELDKQKAL